MRYPTIDQVEKADRLQLARWSRFLKSPGHCAIGQDRELFERTMCSQKGILDRIIVRFAELGGMNPTISKCIGWR
ncbi:hypothetical protein KA005_06765 [bacterium]|nr:hypothetical protein [bacterium]